MRDRKVIALILVLLLAACQTTPQAASPTQETADNRLVLATTTSTDDSGLLAYLLPDFETTFNATIDVVAVGTGQALALGENGDADVLLVHARAREDAFVEAGFGTARYDVMYNDFVIVGPAADPAGVASIEGAVDALKQTAESGEHFISRGDDSGTHSKEQSIWAAANLEPAGDWYVSAGQGMGAVLNMANEQNAYTLSDRATFLTRQQAGLELAVLLEGDPILFNPYGVIPVNPEKHAGIHAALAQQFVAWLTSIETQEKIAAFEVNGEQLFVPNSEAWLAAQP